MRRKRESLHVIHRNINYLASMEMKKIKYKTYYCFIKLSFPWVYCERIKVSIQQRYLHIHVYHGTIHNI